MTEAWLNILPDLLVMLRFDLGVTTTAYNDRFIQYLRSAYEAIVEEGVTPDANSIKDQQLVVSYAAWTWRKRDTGEGMPRMIRYALNNRIFSEKVKQDG